MQNENNGSFLKGMGMGLLVGSAAVMALTPKKRSKNMVGKALKAAGELADNISDAVSR